MNQGSIFNCGFALVMNKRFISLFLLIFTLMGMMACQEKKAVSKQVKVELQSPFWSFNTSRTAKSSLSGTVPEAGLLLSDDQSKGFTIRFTADIKSPESKLCLRYLRYLKSIFVSMIRMIEKYKIIRLIKCWMVRFPY